MLRHLHVRNLALIQDLSLEFGRRLTVFTGETGAGKSILLDALALLSGTRAAPSMVRSGATRATIEAAFDEGEKSRVAEWLSDAGLESDEPGELIIRREIQASGRSRAWVNGRLVPISQLSEVAAYLLVLHGQHEQQSLLEPGVHRELLDEFANLGDRREALQFSYRGMMDAQSHLDALMGEGRDREQRIDFLRFQVEELKSLELQPGEVETLEEEKIRLENVESLVERGNAVRMALVEGTSDGPSAIDLLGTVLSTLERMAECDSGIVPLVESLSEAMARATDAARDLSSYVESLEGDPERLGEVQERMDLIKRVLRKHGPSEREVLDRLRGLEEELSTLENLDTECRKAEERIESCRSELSHAAAGLSGARKRAKRGFLRPLEAMLKEFGMKDVRVDLQFRAVTRGVDVDRKGLLCGPEGTEDLEILFSANQGEVLHPLRKVASGGELSRVMLALRSLTARRGDVPLLVFDEVDAGISGAAVKRVVERLAALGDRHQVLFVTHQPALASVADTHLVVRKEVRSGRTHTVVAKVEGKERLEEVARMLGDGSHSRNSIALAAEMLQIA